MQPKMISGVVWTKLLLSLFEFLEVSLKQETLISNLLNYTTTQKGVALFKMASVKKLWNQRWPDYGLTVYWVNWL